MNGEVFYHKSVKKLIATFSSLFSDVNIVSGKGEVINVPLHFSQKDKVIEMLTNNNDVNDAKSDIALPVMGFEVTNYLYNPERMSNPLSVQNIKRVNDNDLNLSFRSIPYTIGIEMYVMTNTLDEGYQILEQIVPFFTPDLTVTIEDVEMYNLKTNIIFALTALSQDVQYSGDMSEKRIISFQYSFSASTMFHTNPRSVDRIKKVLLNMKEKDHLEQYERLVGNKIGENIEWSNNNDN